MKMFMKIFMKTKKYLTSQIIQKNQINMIR